MKDLTYDLTLTYNIVLQHMIYTSTWEFCPQKKIKIYQKKKAKPRLNIIH